MNESINPFQILTRLNKVRDLSVIQINPDQHLIMACDSSGGIGNKKHDVVKVSPELVAIFTVRVPLFEIIASGATPFYVIDCLSVEMEDTGKKLITAIQSYCRKAGITEPIQYNGSTEDNVPTVQTGLSVMILGLTKDKQHFFPGTSRSNDVVVCAGIPKSGPDDEISLEDSEILAIEDLLLLRHDPAIRDILPVGSKGIAYEANQMAKSASLFFVREPQKRVNIRKSGGPSTCILFSTSRSEIIRLSVLVNAPLTIVGHLTEKGCENIDSASDSSN